MSVWKLTVAVGTLDYVLRYENERQLVTAPALLPVLIHKGRFIYHE
jgi:hypothetical protein